MYVRSKRRPHLPLVSSIGMTTPGHDLDRYRRLRVIPRTRDPRIRSNARDAHGNPDLLADLALRWVDEAVDGWFGRPAKSTRVAAISRRRWFPCGLAFSGVLSLNHGETVDLKAGAQETPDLWLIIDQEN